MKWICIVACRPAGALGVYGDRIVVTVWAFKRSEALSKAISGAVALGWELARVISCEPILADAEDHTERFRSALERISQSSSTDADELITLAKETIQP